MARQLKIFLPAGLLVLIIVSSSCKNSAPVKEGDFIINNKELIFKKAEEGDPYYQGVLAGMYLDEQIMYVQGNKNEAYKWAKKSAGKNHPFGLYNLAEMYNDGSVVGKDENKAKELYLEAYPGLSDLAYSGDQIAQFYLSDLLSSGKGVIQNTDEGSKWLRKAAGQGNAAAQVELGFDLAFALFNKPKLEEYNQGMEWMHKAADQGILIAQFMLAEFYMKPLADGVSPNYKEAIKWYRKVADIGFVGAQLRLADIYYNGEGVQKDHAEAAKWYQKAADQGNEEAKTKLAELKKEAEIKQSITENTYEKMKTNVLDLLDERGKQYQEKIKVQEAQVAQSKKIKDLEEEKLKQKKEKLDNIRARIAKAEEIKKIEDYYAGLPNLPDDQTIIALCERYYNEVQLGGERMRCLQRFIDITEQRERNIR